MSLTKEQRKEFIKEITKLIATARADKIRRKDYGICRNLNRNTSLDICAYELVNLNSESWKHYNPAKGCNTVYPIPTSTYINPPKWEGEQLKLRISFLKHLRRVLKNKTYRYGD
jgi:hypothetical protein